MSNIRSLILLLLLAPQFASAADFYVSPSGSPGGSGSLASPWNIQTAFAHPPQLRPGDKIWLQGGEYPTASGFNSVISGTEAAPILVSSRINERAVLIGNQPSGNALQITGAWTVYKDLELKSSLSTRPENSSGLGFYGHHNSLINSVIHDTGNNSPHGNGNLIYGSLFYYNGGLGSGLGHAMYIQNEDITQPAAFEENIVFGSYAFGFHAYAGGVGKLNGLRFIGNVAFINGAAQSSGELKDNWLVGGVNGLSGVLLRENMGWAAGPASRSVALGRYCCNGSAANKDIVLENNYFVGTTVFQNPFQSIAMTNNLFFGAVTHDGASLQGAYPLNSYLSNAPTDTRVFVRPNRFESGRANIIVYNWSDSDSVEVDLQTVLAGGARYEIRNAQNYFGSPVAAAVYSGGPVSLPMSGLDMADPAAGGLIDPAERTGKKFNVFIVRQLTPLYAPPQVPTGLTVLH